MTTKLYEFRALLGCHVVVGADSQAAAEAKLERWGYGAWIAAGETDDPTEFELVNERSIPDDCEDPADFAHVVAEGDSPTEET